MTIVQVCPCPFPSLGGPARSYQHFDQTLQTKIIGWLRSGEATTEKPVVPLAATVPVFDRYGLGRYYYAAPSCLEEAERIVAHADCVIVHGFFLYPEIWTMRVCRRHGVPYMVVPHGIFDPWAMKKNALIKSLWMRRYGQEILRHAGMVLLATERERTKAACLQEGVRTAVVKWAVEVPALEAARARREEVRAKLGYAASDRVLVFFGRLHSMKRPRETVRLLADFAIKGVKMLVVGPDGDVTAAGLESEAQRAGWDGLRVTGPVWGDDKFAYLCAADGYVSLSHRENFNYALGEAMAAGLPPILSPGNDLRWEFANEGFAWQLRGESPEELRAAVESFATIPASALQERGEAARCWAEHHLSMARFDGELQALLADVARRRGGDRVSKTGLPQSYCLKTM